MKTKILTMLQMQDEMNRKVHPDWKQQDFSWYRAIWTECAELMDHYGWKWWKKQQPDIEQIKLELVDIWHFGLSILILEEYSADAIAKDIERQYETTLSDTDFKAALEKFALSTLNSKSFDISVFTILLQHMETSFDELYRIYIGKNVLNFFRQDHGYKDGSYIKIWDGREDNEHLVDIIAKLDSDASSFRENIYQALANLYEKLN